jgi:hypothetical protein
LSPIVDNGCAYGRIIGKKQFYKVGNDLIVLYFDNKVFSIADGDFNKIDYAKRILRSEPEQKIFAHSLSADDATKSKALDLRTLGTVTLCPNSCPRNLGTFSELNSSNDKRLTANTSLINNSSASTTTMNFDVIVRCNVWNDKKPTFFWRGDGSGFNWGFGWDIEVTSFNRTIFQNTNTQAGGWTWDVFSSSLNNADVVIASGTVQQSADPFDFTNTLFNGINVCINREGIRAERFDNQVTLKDPPRWFCQK